MSMNGQKEFCRSPKYSQNLTGFAEKGGGYGGGGAADQPLHPHDGVAAIRPGARVGDVEVIPTSLGGELRIANFDVIPERGIASLHDTDQRFRKLSLKQGGLGRAGIGSERTHSEWG